MTLLTGITERYECKYLVPEPVARRILIAVSAFVRPDSHAASRPRFTYPICSLYLDGDGFGLYRETIEGKRNRFKLRVRSYSDAPESPVFLEVKSRDGRIVRKQRCPVPRTMLPVILAAQPCEIPNLSAAHRLGLREFSRLAQLMTARPRVLVRYDREAYVAADHSDVRVTFDRALRTRTTDQPWVLLDAPGFHAVTNRGVVVELKFNNRCPAWLLQVIRRHSMQRISFSKYCHAVDRARAASSIEAG